MKDRREMILDSVDNLVGAWLYYDRKNDEDLPLDAIEDAIAAKEVSAEDIIQRFRATLLGALSDGSIG